MYKSYKGKNVDVDKLRRQGEKTVTSGNTKTNARGDSLGPGGSVKEKASSNARKHYKNTQTTVENSASIKGQRPSEESLKPPKEESKKKSQKQSPKKVEEELPNGDIVVKDESESNKGEDNDKKGD